MNVVVPLEFPGGLDTLPSRSDLDEDTVLVNTEGLVEGEELLGLGLGGLLVEGKAGIDLSGDTARNDFENLLAELDELCPPITIQELESSSQRTCKDKKKGCLRDISVIVPGRCPQSSSTHQTIESSISLGVEVAALLLGISDRDIDQLLVLRLVGGSKDE